MHTYMTTDVKPIPYTRLDELNLVLQNLESLPMQGRDRHAIRNIKNKIKREKSSISQLTVSPEKNVKASVVTPKFTSPNLESAKLASEEHNLLFSELLKTVIHLNTLSYSVSVLSDAVTAQLQSNSTLTRVVSDFVQTTRQLLDVKPAKEYSVIILKESVVPAYQTVWAYTSNRDCWGWSWWNHETALVYKKKLDNRICAYYWIASPLALTLTEFNPAYIASLILKEQTELSNLSESLIKSIFPVQVDLIKAQIAAKKQSVISLESQHQRSTLKENIEREFNYKPTRANKIYSEAPWIPSPILTLQKEVLLLEKTVLSARSAPRVVTNALQSIIEKEKEITQINSVVPLAIKAENLDLYLIDKAPRKAELEQLLIVEASKKQAVANAYKLLIAVPKADRDLKKISDAAATLSASKKLVKEFRAELDPILKRETERAELKDTANKILINKSVGPVVLTLRQQAIVDENALKAKAQRRAREIKVIVPQTESLIDEALRVSERIKEHKLKIEKLKAEQIVALNKEKLLINETPSSTLQTIRDEIKALVKTAAVLQAKKSLPGASELINLDWVNDELERKRAELARFPDPDKNSKK